MVDGDGVTLFACCPLSPHYEGLWTNFLKLKSLRTCTMLHMHQHAGQLLVFFFSLSAVLLDAFKWAEMKSPCSLSVSAYGAARGQINDPDMCGCRRTNNLTWIKKFVTPPLWLHWNLERDMFSCFRAGAAEWFNEAHYLNRTVQISIFAGWISYRII